MLHFITGQSGSGKTEYIYKKIAKQSESMNDKRIYLLVPEQYTFQAQKSLVSQCHGKGMLYTEVQSFIRLAYRVFADVGCDNIPVLDDVGKSMLLRKVLADNKSKMGYFGKNSAKKGYVRDILSFISEMKQYGIDEENLTEMISTSNNKPALKNKLSDMTIAFNAFNEYVKDHYITSEEIISQLTAVLGKSELLKGSIVYLDGYTGFTPLQYKLIGEMMTICDDVYVSVTIDTGASVLKEEMNLFSMSQKTISKLKLIADETETDIDEDTVINNNENGVPARFSMSEDMGHLEKSLFRTNIKKYEGRPEHISIHELRQPEDEISFIIRKIKQLLMDKKCKYADIGIVCGDLHSYGILLNNSFTRAGIPVFIDDKKDITNNTFIEAIKKLFDILISDFEYSSIMAYLRSGYANGGNDNAFSEDKLDIVDNFLVASGIRGHKSWCKEWDGAELLGIRGEEETIKTNSMLNLVRETAAKPLIELYNSIGKGKHTVTEICTRVCTYLYEQGIKNHIDNLCEEYEKRSDLQSAGEYRQVYGIFLKIIENMQGLLGDEEVDISEFVDIFESGLSESKIGSVPPKSDSIIAGDIIRTRFGNIKYLFFIGANDCNIPKSSSKGGVLSDSDRLFLEEAGFELSPTTRENAFIEQFYLYINMTKPSQELCVTFCETGNDGLSQNPSYIINRIRKPFPKLEIANEIDNYDEERIIGSDMGKTFLLYGITEKYHLDNKENKNKITEDGSDIDVKASNVIQEKMNEEIYKAAMWKTLYNYYIKNDLFREKIKTWLQASMYINGENKIAGMTAKKLYDKRTYVSTSQLEKYAGCAYAYFLQYGLGLKERQIHEVQSFDLGNIIHDALKLYADELVNEGKNWHEIDESSSQAMANTCVDKVVNNYKKGLLYDTDRDTYLIERIKRLMRRTVNVLAYQMSKGNFKTYDTEFAFDIDGPVNLKGRVDRIDTAEDENGIYVKIIDYKTGNKNLSVNDLYYGLQMQLVIYLKASMQLTDEWQKKNEDKKVVVPAGMFYFNIDDPIIEIASKNKDVEYERFKALRLKGKTNEQSPVLRYMDSDISDDSDNLIGLTESSVVNVKVNKDGGLYKGAETATLENLNTMIEYTQNKITELATDIKSGKADINPYKIDDGGVRTACTWCPYDSVCGFDTSMGFKYNKITKKDEDEVFKSMKEALTDKDKK